MMTVISMSILAQTQVDTLSYAKGSQKQCHGFYVETKDTTFGFNVEGSAYEQSQFIAEEATYGAVFDSILFQRSIEKMDTNFEDIKAFRSWGNAMTQATRANSFITDESVMQIQSIGQAYNILTTNVGIGDNIRIFQINQIQLIILSGDRNWLIGGGIQFHTAQNKNAILKNTWYVFIQYWLHRL